MSQPTFFIRVHEGKVVDICSDVAGETPRFVVIDENDHGVEIEADDGTTFRAEVYDLQDTAPHFDPEDVVSKSAGRMSNGVFEAAVAAPKI